MEFQFGPIQEKWLKSLEEHPERQGKQVLGYRALGSEDYRACCLGELGLIAGICEWHGVSLFTRGGVFSSLLTDVYEEVGLRSENGSPNSLQCYSLACLNDEKMTWPEIAAHIRANPTEYFTKSL